MIIIEQIGSYNMHIILLSVLALLYLSYYDL